MSRPTLSVTVLPEGRVVPCSEGANLLEVLRKAGVLLRADCDGRGTCGRCRVRFLNNPPTPLSGEACLLTGRELLDGWRLACQHPVARPATLVLPGGTGDPTSLQTDSVPSPTHRAEGDANKATSHSRDPERLEAGRSLLGSLERRIDEPPSASPGAPRELAEVVASPAETPMASCLGSHVVRTGRAEGKGAILGVALDVGTSTLAAYLIDLGTRRTLAATSQANPQQAFGADVLTRIAYVQSHGPDGLRRLRDALHAGVHALLVALSQSAGASQEDIVATSVVGNPTMLHFLLGVSPVSIGQAPHKPAWQGRMDVSAAALGLALHPEAIVVLLPFVSGYLGADLVAGILATGLHEADRPELLLDLGTNGEIALGSRHGVAAASAAAGPAFEGGKVSCGMPSIEGAVAHVDFDGTIRCETIGGGRPAGLCGTGLVDTVALLLSHGGLDESGRLRRPPGSALGARFVEDERLGLRLRLAEGEPPVEIRQEDVREFQLAKGAVRAAIETLLEETRTSPDSVARVHLAGAFGSQVRPDALTRIGLLPREWAGRTTAVGHAAGHGAVHALIDRGVLEQAVELATRIRVLSLADNKGFARRFVDHLGFPAGTLPPTREGTS